MKKNIRAYYIVYKSGMETATTKTTGSQSNTLAPCPPIKDDEWEECSSVSSETIKKYTEEIEMEWLRLDIEDWIKMGNTPVGIPKTLLTPKS